MSNGMEIDVGLKKGFIKEGDQILVHVDDFGNGAKELTLVALGGVKTIPATLIEVNGCEMVLGWKDGEEHPYDTYTPRSCGRLDWEQQGFALVKEGYGTHCYFLPYRSQLTGKINSDSVPIRQESPCRSCNRPNDLGVKSCWWCGSQPNN